MAETLEADGCEDGTEVRVCIGEGSAGRDV